MSRLNISSRPDQWTNPRPHRDASQRLHSYGKLQPLDGEHAMDLSRGFVSALILFALGAVLLFFAATLVAVL